MSKITRNQPSIKFTYIQMRNDPVKKNSLLKLHPESKDTFLETDKVIRHICDRILYTYRNAYRNRYKVSADEYAVILKVHKWFLQNKNRVVDIYIVIQTVNKLNAEIINRMIDNYIFDRRKEDVLAEIIEIGREKEAKAIEDDYFKFENE